MAKFIVDGGHKLRGEVYIRGAKNAALPLFSAALLTDEEIVIHNCPRIVDVFHMRSILERVGCTVSFFGNTAKIRAKEATCAVMPEDISRKIRSSIFMLGSLIGRFRQAIAILPGGCEIGARPIDLHLAALKQLGIQIEEDGDRILCQCQELIGGNINLDYPSVGATENAMMAAVLAKGRTTIQNAACEPEIADLGGMLNSMGAKVLGAGTPSVIIEGVEKLHGTVYTCMPDRIEAATYLCAGAITRGDVTVLGIRPGEIKAVTDVLQQAGAVVDLEKSKIRIRTKGRLKAIPGIKTQPYPGFPTDAQAQLCALMAYADGVTKIEETVFDNRMRHVAELQKMQADIQVIGNTAYITGKEMLYPAYLYATDLRGGAAMVLAALGARGRSTVAGAGLIDRGYEAMETQMAALGADIRRVQD